MRPSSVLILIFAGLFAIDAVIYCVVGGPFDDVQNLANVDQLTATLGLTDLCLATEARYTRHLAITDTVAPFMDGPTSLEHFPSGSFYGVIR